jgi:hypothetical protein
MRTLEAVMSEPIDIAGIGQRARRAAWQDGILELFGGLFFLFYAVIVDDLTRGVRPHPAVVLSMVLICSWPLIHLVIVRSAFTFPRMGYVETKVALAARHVAVLVLLLLLPLVTYVGVEHFGHTVDAALVSTWGSVALGCGLGALYLGFARSQGDKLYLALAAALVILGIALSQVTRGLSILLVLNSALLLLYGIYKLIRFVIRYPRADGRGGGNDQFEDHAGS